MMTNNSFLDALGATLANNRDLPALTDFKGETITYNQVALKIAKLHSVFEACGLQKGDKVSIVGRNSANWGITFLSVLSYGAVAVPILHEFKADNVHHIVNHSESRILFTGSSNWDDLDESKMPDLEAIIRINDFSIIKVGHDDMESVRQTIDRMQTERFADGFSVDDFKFHRDQPEELAVINYTSGTTGFSKGVMLPYRSLVSNVRFASEALPQLSRGDSVVAMLPMAHMYGLAFEFLFEIMTGCHIHFLTRMPTPKIILEAFAAVRPKLVVSVPLIIEKIYKKQLLPAINKPFVKMALKLPVIDKRILKKINEKLIGFFGGDVLEIVIGGAPFGRDAEKFFKRIGFPYTVGYGMTECGPLITFEDWSKVPIYSCGKAITRMEVKIDSPDPENIAGEIIVRGDNVMLGYYKKPEATAEAMRDGWLHTGDLGTMDKTGYIYIKGRSKATIIGPSGQNIYPEEIESILNNMPYVSESVVIEMNGKLVALVYPDYDSADKEKIAADELVEKLEKAGKEANKQLPAYCQIAQVKLHPEEFEKTPKRSIKRFLYQKA